MDKYKSLRLENQLCFPLYAAAKEVVKRYKPFLDKIGLTYTQYIIMMVMWEHKKLTVKELGSYLYLDSGTLTPVLKTMEKKELVLRKRTTEDERVLNVSLTEKGNLLKESALQIPKRMQNCVQLDDSEAVELQRLLKKLLSKM